MYIYIYIYIYIYTYISLSLSLSLSIYIYIYITLLLVWYINLHIAIMIHCILQASPGNCVAAARVCRHVWTYQAEGLRLHRWNSSPRPQPQKLSKLLSLIHISQHYICLNWLSEALGGVGGSDFIG